MAIKITLKNSVVQDSVPTTSHLAAVGELALNANINSLGIYMRASDNSIVKMAGPGSVTTPAASTTAAGIAELATSAETTTGTDTARVCTPAGVKAVSDAERTTSNNTYLALAGGTLTGVLAATAGSNSAPAIHFGDSDSGIYGGTNTVSLAAGGTQGLTLDSSGYVNVPTRLGVGIGAPVRAFHIHEGSAASAYLHMTNATTGSATTDGFSLYVSTAGEAYYRARETTGKHIFYVNSNEAARVDSSGRLLVGTSSSRNTGGSTGSIQVEGTSYSTSSFSLTRNSNDSGNAFFVLGKARGATVGSNTIVQDDDNLGAVRFAGSDGTDLNSIAAQIQAQVDGTPGADDMPGRLVFGTTADGAASPTTRLTITSAGLVNVPDDGKFTAGASNDLQIYHDATHSWVQNSTGNLYLGNASGNTNHVHIQAKYGDEGIVVYDDAQVELYYDGSKKLETLTDGAKINGSKIEVINTASAGDAQLYLEAGEGGTAFIQFIADNGDDNTDKSRILQADGANLKIQNYDSGSWLTRLETTSAGCLLGDSVKLQFGAGPDLQVYHDGSNSYITNSTSNLILSNSNTDSKSISLYGDSGLSENLAHFIQGGAVELYYNNLKRLETGSSGIQVTGPDNDYASIDLFSDLGTHDADKFRLHVDDGGPFYIKNKTSGSWENNLAAIGNGSLYLYYDNSKKLETTSSGIKVTAASGTGQIQLTRGAVAWDANTTSSVAYMGTSTAHNCTLRAHGATQTNIIDGGMRWNDNKKAFFGTGDDLQIFHDGTYSRIQDSSTNFVFDANRFTINKPGSPVENIFDANSNGAVTLYYDDSAKFATSSDGTTTTGNATFAGTLAPSTTDIYSLGYSSQRWENIYMNNDMFIKDNGRICFGDSNDFQIQHDGSNSYITDAGTGFLIIKGNEVQIQSDGGEDQAKFVGNGAVELYYNNELAFTTTTTGADIKSTSANATSVWMKYITDNGSIRGYVYANNNDEIGFLNPSGGWSYRVESDGDYQHYGSSISDRDRKDNITTISGTSLDKITKLVPKTFTWKQDDSGKVPTDRTFTGFIAQEVKEHLPDIVKGTDGQKNMAVDYNGILAHAVKAITELSAEVETLKTKVAALEGA